MGGVAGRILDQDAALDQGARQARNFFIVADVFAVGRGQGGAIPQLRLGLAGGAHPGQQRGPGGIGVQGAEADIGVERVGVEPALVDGPAKKIQAPLVLPSEGEGGGSFLCSLEMDERAGYGWLIALIVPSCAFVNCRGGGAGFAEKD